MRGNLSNQLRTGSRQIEEENRQSREPTMTESEWLASEDPAAMLRELYQRHNCDEYGADRGDGTPGVSDRKLRLFACACCRQVWHLLTDSSECSAPGCLNGVKLGPSNDPRLRQLLPPHGSGSRCQECNGTGRTNRSRRAVEVAERYADGAATDKELDTAHRLAWNAHSETPLAHNGNAHLYDAAICCSRIALDAVTRMLEEEQSVEPAIQAAILRDLVTPFRPATLTPVRPGDKLRMITEPDYKLVLASSDDLAATVLSVKGDMMTVQPANAPYGQIGRWPTPKPPWLTPDVLRIATTIYEERDFASTPILADALSDAGCDDAGMLAHLRGSEPCVPCGGSGFIIRRSKRITPHRYGPMPDVLHIFDIGDDGGDGDRVEKCDCQSGWRPRAVACNRGCWAIEAILGKG